MKFRILLLLMILWALQVNAQSSEHLRYFHSELEISFEDEFDQTGLDASWFAWNEFPTIVDSQMIISGWQSWDDAVARPNFSDRQGIVERFRFETGMMVVFFDANDYASSDYRQVRLETRGDNRWHVYSSSGVQGQNTRTYGSVTLTPGTWYYVLILIGDDGNFYFQLWADDMQDDLILNLEIQPSGDGWQDQDWWFGNKVYEGQLVVDWFAEIMATDTFVLPCTVRGIGTVNVRSGYDLDQPVIDQLDPRMHRLVQAQSQRPDGYTWWQLAEDAWVRGDVVQESAHCAETVPVAT